METLAYFIIGQQTETAAEIQQSVDLAKSFKAALCSLHDILSIPRNRDLPRRPTPRHHS